MLNPIEVLKSINKKTYILDSQNEAEYVPYVVNRWLSLFPDCLFHVNEMNMYPSIPSKMQYDYLYHSIRARNRFQAWKWNKKTEYEDQLLISGIYKYNSRRAKEALKILSKEQIELLKKQQEKGGIS